MVMWYCQNLSILYSSGQNLKYDFVLTRWRRKNQRRKQRNKRMWTSHGQCPVHLYPGRHGNHLYPHSPHRLKFLRNIVPLLKMIFHDYSILHVFDLSLFTLEGVWYGREMGEFSSITRVSVLPCGRNRRSWLDGQTWTRWYRDPQTATRVQWHWLLFVQILQLV